MTAELDAAYWNNRYQTNDTGWDTGSITTPLKTYFDQLTDKDLRILIPGAGNAYEAEYLISAGFKNVFVCDIAESAKSGLLQRCPDFPEKNFLLADFFGLSGQYDLIVEQTFFCALDPKLRQAYFNKMETLLAENGKLVGVLFDDTLNNDRPPFGGTKEEYLGYLSRSFKVNMFETCCNSIKPRQGRELFMNIERSK